jgi:flagellar export protein FliJ
MADNDYDLEVLLELRTKAKDDAEEAVSEAIAEVSRREHAVQDARSGLEKARITRKKECDAFDNRCVGGGVGIGQIQQFGDYVRALEANEDQIEIEIERLLARVQQGRREVEMARSALAEAVKELEAVRSHKEQWQKERDLVARRRESAAMDEVAARLWRKNKQ